MGPESDLGEAEVEREARHVRPVADPAQPIVLGAQRPVTREKPGDQEDGLAQPGRDVDPAEDGIADESEELEVEASLEPHRRQRIPAAEPAEVRPAATWWFGECCHLWCCSCRGGFGGVGDSIRARVRCARRKPTRALGAPVRRPVRRSRRAYSRIAEANLPRMS